MGQVWFGTKQYSTWIADPNVDMNNGKVGFATQNTFLSGGAWVRRSKTAARAITMSWSPRKRDRLQPVLDFADGVYGPGPFYYADPFAMNKNMLPSYWASPYLNAYDGPLVLSGTRPTLVTAAVTNGYPYESAVYTLGPTTNAPNVFIPIPPGYVAHVGAHGATLSGSNNIIYRTHTPTTESGWSNLTWLSKAAAPTNYVSPTGLSGISISMYGSTNGTMRIDGLIVQVLPEGAVSPVGGFRAGLGTGGLSFVEQPSVTAYSAALDMIGISAELIETEPWT